MSEKKDVSKEIVLGSGDAYVKEVEGTIDTTDIDAVIATYFVKENRFGEVKSGASVKYSQTIYEAYSDLGRARRSILTKEDVTLGFGLITVTTDYIKVLAPTARTTTTKAGRHVVKLGGLENDLNKSYFVGFHHPDPVGGDVWVAIIGKNKGELSFDLKPDSETILNPEFTAQAMDDEGTLIIITIGEPYAKDSDTESGEGDKSGEGEQPA